MRFIQDNWVVRMTALALLCATTVLLYRAGLVRLLVWTEPVLEESDRPWLFGGFVLTALLLVGATGARRRRILVVASLSAMAAFSLSFTLLSLLFFGLHYKVVFAAIPSSLKVGFLLATFAAWGIACDSLLWPNLVAEHPSVLVFGYVFAVSYTFRLFYFHHEMKLKNFERVSFSSYFLYMAFAPYFIVLPYMMAIPRFRDFSRHLDQADPKAEAEGIRLIALGLIYALGWYGVRMVFDPRTEIMSRLAAEDWPAVLGLGLLYAPYTFANVVGDALILIGLINVLGVRVHPPFKRPLSAPSVLEWWRRWNTHFRDFLVDVFYYPLLVRWRTRNRYLTIVVGCFMVFIVGSGFFHWTAKYYFIHASHGRIMWGVMAENLFMFAFVAVGLCLEQRRIGKRIARPRPSSQRRLFQILSTWAVLALGVVFIGRGVDHYFYARDSSRVPNQLERKDRTMQQELPIRSALRSFIAGISNHALESDETDLIESGVIDSIRVLDLLNYVADAFRIEITERDIYEGHFASIASMAALVSLRSP